MCELLGQHVCHALQNPSQVLPNSAARYLTGGRLLGDLQEEGATVHSPPAQNSAFVFWVCAASRENESSLIAVEIVKITQDLPQDRGNY